MSLLHRIVSAVQDRYRRSAIAQYGAGLHTDCEDHDDPSPGVTVPSPRRDHAPDRDRNGMR